MKRKGKTVQAGAGRRSADKEKVLLGERTDKGQVWSVDWGGRWGGSQWRAGWGRSLRAWSAIEDLPFKLREKPFKR